jgi:hypothetical protein
VKILNPTMQPVNCGEPNYADRLQSCRVTLQSSNFANALSRLLTIAELGSNRYLEVPLSS